MLRITFAIALLTLVACGSGEGTSSTAETAGGSPAASAPEAGASPAPVSAPAEVAADSPDARRCLDLVRDAEFETALPICVNALEENPGNAEVQAATDKAKAEVASLTDAKEAAEAQAQGVVDGANETTGSAVGDAVGKVPGQ